ncbi:MAG TPA: exodeoxyribonuclease VII small subunit [Lachnospiraceae bacterium]|nr:exodeoxyribonuclease VII small subunit [Lachnospiraceae bacterium]
MAKKKLSYEDALAQIEQIAQTLENEEVSLEKSIKLYKEGMELTLFCRNTLEVAEKEVMELKKTFDGKYTLTAFDQNEED